MPSPLVSLTATARCQGCDWTAAGKLADTDKAAGKHTATGHPTAVMAVPGDSGSAGGWCGRDDSNHSRNH